MAVKSSKVWDITMGPVKRRGVGVVLSPIPNKKTRIALEIVGPAKQRTVDLSPLPRRFVVSFRNFQQDDEDDEEEEDPRAEGAYLVDDEDIRVRIYRKRTDTIGARKLHASLLRNLSTLGVRKDRLLPDASMRTIGSSAHESTETPLNFDAGEESGDEMDSFYQDKQDIILFPSDMKEWVSYKEYPVGGCAIRKSHANVLETQLSSGLTSTVRDLIFQSTQERESFQNLCTQLARLGEKRARQQLKRYRQVKQDTREDPSDAIDQSPSEQADETIRLLIEIVSATDLPGRFSMDPYVVIRIGKRVIHRTSVLKETQNPIWTIQTGSLCLLCASPEDLISNSSWGELKFSLLDFNALAKHEVIGAVKFSLKHLLTCKGERVGYDINLADDSDRVSHNAKLFLRIREATTEDIQFMKDLERYFGKEGVYSEETLFPMRPPQSTLLKFQQKHDDESEIMHRVRPFPDPDREEETTWLSSDNLYKESMMTSTNWVEAGSGDLGQLYVEILGCSDLPNMDRAVLGRKTDAFASIVFEDAAVTTDVIGQCLSPRWMPWSRRAFVFNVQHPSSALFIAMFDHDPEFLTEFVSAAVHDPIGRIEVQVSNFEHDTIYTLAYPLFFGDEIDEHNKKEKGKVWLRLRKTWKDNTKAMLVATAPAPPTVVSLARPIDCRVVRYTTVGPRDDTGFNIWKFTEYISELQGYEYILAYVKDFALNTWLWRGHCQLKIFGSKRALPLHSLTAFFWGVVVTHDFNKLPSFILFSIGWLLLACNEAVNKTPSPWHKCPAYYPHIWSLILRSKSDTVAIAPYQRLRSISKFDEAREKRDKWAEKERELLNEQQREMQQVLLGVDGEDAYHSVQDITTGSRKESLMMRFLFPLKPVLYPIQEEMRQVVIYCRVASSILLWEESNFAFWITTASFVGSVAIYNIPLLDLIGRILKISAWVFLGPWMLLADRWFFKDSQPVQDAITDEERNERIKQLMRKQYDRLMEQALNYQIRKENIVKMKSMQSYMFGSYQARVPRFRERRFKDNPLPESYAEPYEIEDAEPTIIVERKYGQKLSGDMIPKKEFEAHSARTDFEHERKPVFSLLAEQMQSLVNQPSRLLAKTRNAVFMNPKTEVQRPLLGEKNENKPKKGRVRASKSNAKRSSPSPSRSSGNRASF